MNRILKGLIKGFFEFIYNTVRLGVGYLAIVSATIIFLRSAIYHNVWFAILALLGAGAGIDILKSIKK